MKKKFWAFIKERISFGGYIIDGYTFHCAEYLGKNNGRYHDIIEIESNIKSQATCQSLLKVKELTKKKLDKIIALRACLDWGLRPLMEEIRDIHDMTTLGLFSDTPQKLNPDQKRLVKKMLEYGKKAIEQHEKFRSERNGKCYDGSVIRPAIKP